MSICSPVCSPALDFYPSRSVWFSVVSRRRNHDDLLPVAPGLLDALGVAPLVLGDARSVQTAGRARIQYLNA